MDSPSVFLTSNASDRGWGGTNKDKTGKIISNTGGMLSPIESNDHINILELKAAWLILRCFCMDLSNVHIRISIDNTTALALHQKHWRENTKFGYYGQNHNMGMVCPTKYLVTGCPHSRQT